MGSRAGQNPVRSGCAARGARFEATYRLEMPTIRWLGPARFYFYSNEGDEPPHVHVEQGQATAKFWLDPVSLAWSKRFRAHELRWLERMVRLHQSAFLETWREFFESDS